MSRDLESVLRQVAAGELTPEQALEQLDGPPPTRAATPEPGAPISDAGTTDTEGSTSEEISTIRLKTRYRSIQLIADPTVSQVHVLGEHSIRHEGSALVISTAGPLDDDRGRPDQGESTAGRFSFSDLPRTIAWARSWREHQLTVRVNPTLLLELEATGVDVKITGLGSGLRARLVASSLRADKLHCPLDIEAISSSVKLTGIPTGESRIHGESSSIRLSLSAGSNLRIIATNRMSRLALLDLPPSTLPLEGETQETTIGDGRDRLSLEAVMSSVTINADAWGSVPA